jgi:hypothetical protein
MHICGALSLACLRDAASVEATALRRLAHARGRELRTVCRLAQAVLRQRSDVETFLVAALQQACAVMKWPCCNAPHQIPVSATWESHDTSPICVRGPWSRWSCTALKMLAWQEHAESVCAMATWPAN